MSAVSVLLARVCFAANKRKKNYMLEQHRQHMFSNLNQFGIALSDDPCKIVLTWETYS